MTCECKMLLHKQCNAKVIMYFLVLFDSFESPWHIKMVAQNSGRCPAPRTKLKYFHRKRMIAYHVISPVHRRLFNGIAYLSLNSLYHATERPGYKGTRVHLELTMAISHYESLEVIIVSSITSAIYSAKRKRSWMNSREKVSTFF